MMNTIRGRITAVFIAILAFVMVLTAFYYWNLFSIQKRLGIAEDFEDLLNNVLEIRRYEKNFIYYQDMASLEKTISYVNKTERLTADLAADIKRVAGEESFQEFRNNLGSYKTMFVEDHTRIENGGPSRMNVDNVRMNVDNVRAAGKGLVDFAQQLLKIKRQRIHRALTRTLSIPAAFVVSQVILILVFHLVVSNILKPLALIQSTTEEVAKGNFTPIAYETKRKDEISDLIGAFNKMAAEIETRQEELVQSRKIAAIGTFTSGIAHELNNPVNNIYLTAETLMEDYNSLSSPEAKELILDILNQADRASNIVRNLLDFSRSERPVVAELDIREVIDSTLKLVKNQIMIAGISLEKKFADDLPPTRGNLRNLQQVFLNLFLNSIQAMPQGGTISVTAYQDSEDYLRVDIADTGEGIKPEDLEHIFEPFYTTKSVGRGTGLGLAVTYSIVKKHGGYIEVKSEQGAGTTFSLYLPPAQPDGIRENADSNR